MFLGRKLSIHFFEKVNYFALSRKAFVYFNTPLEILLNQSKFSQTP